MNHVPPSREAFTDEEWAIIKAHRSPRRVQRFLTRMSYNWLRDGVTQRSFREVLRRREAHCMEAALTAAVILEQHGYPPLVMSLASQDKLDHVIFIFRQKGLWGSVGRSRDVGLHGRRPVFQNPRHLAWSYFDPYVDMTARLTGYAVAHLYDLGNYDWRFSSKNIWKAERLLQEIPHEDLRSSERRYQLLLARYREFRRRYPDKQLTYFANRRTWML